MINWNCRIAYQSSQVIKRTLKAQKPAAVEVGRLLAPAVEGPPSPGEPRANLLLRVPSLKRGL